jgi:sulfur-carrier protein
MAALKSFHMQYYAAFRDAAGVPGETIQSAAGTASELYTEIARRHGINFDFSFLGVALNDQVVPWTSRLSDGDTVVFLAPFAGG